MKLKLLVLFFLVCLISISFSQNSLVIYQQNIAVVSFEKEVELRKGMNFIPINEISGSLSPENLYVLSSKGNPIKEIVYPSLGIWIESYDDSKDILKIFYVVSNIKWNAQHMFLIDGDKLRFNSKVVIQNSSDISFQKVKISILAGSLSIERERYPLLKSEAAITESYMPSIPEAMTAQGYKIFDISGEWSISKGTIKIIPLLDTIIKYAKKRYVLGYRGDMKNVYIVWNIENKKENGLGVPIPSGILNIFSINDNKTIFLGSASISNIPEGEVIEVVQGQDFDLSVDRKVLEEKSRIEGRYEVIERRISTRIKSSKKEKIMVEVLENIPGGEVEIKESNFPYEKLDKNNFVFKVVLEAEKEAILIYRCIVRNLR